MATNGQQPGDDQLLDYVSGRLSADAETAIETAAAQDPALAADIALMQGMRRSLAEDDSDMPPGELGWRRLERAMDAADKTSADPVSAPASQPMAQPAPRRAPLLAVAAAAAVAAVVSWQFVALPLMTGTEPGYGTASGPAGAEFTVTVGFAANASMAQIQALLTDTGGRVIDGPSALGLWQIAFDSAAARDGSAEAYAASDLVDHVQSN
ncbi:MAG: hypothetical protein CML68_15770 [Rhodobacteraceae bacterium]|nr:hypothetical protein [Paracoccaceae bacterium]